MGPKDDGGPFHVINNNGAIVPGASLRDMFAMAAMQALLSPNHPWGGYPEKGIPRVAYEMADAMLRAREQRT